jgi:hypothetical protein
MFGLFTTTIKNYKFPYKYNFCAVIQGNRIKLSKLFLECHSISRPRASPAYSRRPGIGRSPQTCRRGRRGPRLQLRFNCRPPSAATCSEPLPCDFPIRCILSKFKLSRRLRNRCPSPVFLGIIILRRCSSRRR